MNSKWTNLVNDLHRMEKLTMRITNLVHIFDDTVDVKYRTQHITNIPLVICDN